MCRLLVYFGENTYLYNIIYNPPHNIIKQSYSLAYTPNIEQNVLNTNLNLDGFGCGWWVPEKENFYFYKSLKSIWNDTLLNSISHSIKSPLIFAHIRAVLKRKSTPVSDLNTHPFVINKWIWMHNGCIINFNKYKKKLSLFIKPHILSNIYGSTDSEYCFGIFLSFLEKNKNILESFILVFKYLKKNKCKGYYNFITSNGSHILGSRIIIGIAKAPLSLYFDNINKIISSEPIYPDSKWIKIPKNNIIYYNKNNNTYKMYDLSNMIN